MCMHASIQSVYIYLNTIVHISSGITRGLNEALYCPPTTMRAGSAFIQVMTICLCDIKPREVIQHTGPNPQQYSINCSNLELSLTSDVCGGYIKNFHVQPEHCSTCLLVILQQGGDFLFQQNYTNHIIIPISPYYSTWAPYYSTTSLANMIDKAFPDRTCMEHNGTKSDLFSEPNYNFCCIRSTEAWGIIIIYHRVLFTI